MEPQAPEQGIDSPPLSIYSPVERLHRLHGALEAIADALRGDAHYSPHFTRRARAIELAVDELDAITHELEAHRQ